MGPLQGCTLLGSGRRDGFAYEELIAFIKERTHKTASNIPKQTDFLDSSRGVKAKMFMGHQHLVSRHSPIHRADFTLSA